MRTLLRNELLGLWRKRRFLVLGAVLLFFGALGPLSIRYLPQLLSQIPGAPEGLEAVLPQPDAAMALTEFGENMTQFGALMVVLMTMGAVAVERERGTAMFVLSKPVSRAVFLGAKYIAHALLLLFGLVIAALTGYYYLGILFQWLPVDSFVVYIGVLFLYWQLIASITFLASVWARSQMAVAGSSLGLLFAGSLLGLIPNIKPFMPATALSWASNLALGGEQAPPWGSLIALLAVILFLPLLAWMRFRRQEL